MGVPHVQSGSGGRLMGGSDSRKLLRFPESYTVKSLRTICFGGVRRRVQILSLVRFERHSLSIVAYLVNCVYHLQKRWPVPTTNRLKLAYKGSRKALSWRNRLQRAFSSSNHSRFILSISIPRAGKFTEKNDIHLSLTITEFGRQMF